MRRTQRRSPFRHTSSKEFSKLPLVISTIYYLILYFKNILNFSGFYTLGFREVGSAVVLDEKMDIFVSSKYVIKLNLDGLINSLLNMRLHLTLKHNFSNHKCYANP